MRGKLRILTLDPGYEPPEGLVEKLHRVATDVGVIINIHAGLDTVFNVYHDNFELEGDPLRRTLRVKWVSYRPGEKPGELINRVAEELGYGLVWPKSLKFPRNGELLDGIEFEDGVNHYIIETESGRFILTGIVQSVDFIPMAFNGEDAYCEDGEPDGRGVHGGGSLAPGRVEPRKVAGLLVGFAGRLAGIVKSLLARSRVVFNPHLRDFDDSRFLARCVQNG